MATNPSSISVAASMRGISNSLAGFVIESETINESDIAEQVPDQDGAIAGEISYDKRTDLRLTIRKSGASGGTLPTVGGTLTYSTVKYHVDNVEEAGSYNGLRRWNVTAHRYTNWPS